jgi:hypothetical protein
MIEWGYTYKEWVNKRGINRSYCFSVRPFMWKFGYETWEFDNTRIRFIDIGPFGWVLSWNLRRVK